MSACESFLFRACYMLESQGTANDARLYPKRRRYVYASARPWSFHEGLDELTAVERPPEVKRLGPQPGAQTGEVEAEVK